MTSETFWNRQAARYAAKPIADMDAYAAKLARVRRHLRPSDRILEIGCGTGGTARTLARDVTHVTASDLSGEMIRIARERQGTGQKGAPQVSFLRADAAARMPGAPFDAILAFSLLHLVPDIGALLESVRDQLKPGGLFMSKTVCMKDRPAYQRVMLRTLMGLGIAPRVNFLSRDDLADALDEYGFALIDSTSFDASGQTPFLVARRG